MTTWLYNQSNITYVWCNLAAVVLNMCSLKLILACSGIVQNGNYIIARFVWMEWTWLDFLGQFCSLFVESKKKKGLGAYAYVCTTPEVFFFFILSKHYFLIMSFNFYPTLYMLYPMGVAAMNRTELVKLKRPGQRASHTARSRTARPFARWTTG